MNKQVLISIINKYYLDGLIETVLLKIKDKKLTIDFGSTYKDMKGLIEADFDLEDCNLGIYNTSQLIKLININDDELNIEIDKQGIITRKIKIKSKDYDLEYCLVEELLIPNPPQLEVEPEYDTYFPITLDFINKFIKAEKATNSELISISPSFESKGLTFTLGGKGDYNNKIKFTEPCNYEGIINVLSFNLIEFKEILDNNKDLVSGIFNYSNEGMIKIQFISKDNIKSTYYLIANE